MHRYWLFKSEPDVFAYADLERSPGQQACWEGVRNYQARNLLRDEVKCGDKVLFYHSRVDPIGVAGIAEVVQEAYPDPTQFEPGAKYYDEKSPADAPRWLMVDIRALEGFSRIVTLAELKVTPGLEQMMVTRKGARLSIQPVSSSEWDIVVALGRNPA